MKSEYRGNADRKKIHAFGELLLWTAKAALQGVVHPFFQVYYLPSGSKIACVMMSLFFIAQEQLNPENKKATCLCESLYQDPGTQGIFLKVTVLRFYCS